MNVDGVVGAGAALRQLERRIAWPHSTQSAHCAPVDCFAGIGLASSEIREMVCKAMRYRVRSFAREPNRLQGYVVPEHFPSGFRKNTQQLYLTLRSPKVSIEAALSRYRKNHPCRTTTFANQLTTTLLSIGDHLARQYLQLSDR